MQKGCSFTINLASDVYLTANFAPVFLLAVLSLFVELKMLKLLFNQETSTFI